MKENQVLTFLETILFKKGYRDHSICFTKNDWLFKYQNDTNLKTDYFVCVIIRQQKGEVIFYGSSEETYYKAVVNVIEKIKTAREVESRAA
jgi:hypothetical protein